MNDPQLQAFYDSFYQTAECSTTFSDYCTRLYGIDFSQDGFSDLSQINALIDMLNLNSSSKVLDIGCGNGKMCEYIHDKTGASVYGFDYSFSAIFSAIARTRDKNRKLVFQTGLIGEKEYSPEIFDAVLSIDTMNYAVEPESFVKQIVRWLKPGGAFAAFYCQTRFGEATPSDILIKEYTPLAKAFDASGITYEAWDYTRAFYDFMRRKRLVAQDLKKDFSKSGLMEYYERLVRQSVDEKMPYDVFKKCFSRFLYLAKKPYESY
jgi:2-polyprenyl-3-methyl-5-hydroxy-6-metoxy-1,4-benzoquinol methylase